MCKAFWRTCETYQLWTVLLCAAQTPTSQWAQPSRCSICRPLALCKQLLLTAQEAFNQARSPQPTLTTSKRPPVAPSRPSLTSVGNKNTFQSLSNLYIPPKRPNRSNRFYANTKPNLGRFWPTRPERPMESTTRAPQHLNHITSPSAAAAQAPNTSQ